MGVILVSQQWIRKANGVINKNLFNSKFKIKSPRKIYYKLEKKPNERA